MTAVAPGAQQLAQPLVAGAADSAQALSAGSRARGEAYRPRPAAA
jgi:hypothetical protein